MQRRKASHQAEPGLCLPARASTALLDWWYTMSTAEPRGRLYRPASSSSVIKHPVVISDLLNQKARAFLRKKMDIAYLRDLPGLDALYSSPEEPEVLGPSGRVYGAQALCCCLPGYEPRRSAIMFVESRYFDPFILLTILINCGTMALESPLDEPGTWKAEAIDNFEWMFLAIFTSELLAKVLAYGLITHSGSYLRDPWCQLDLAVVTLAWLPILVPTLGHYSTLRALRVLRPLRALKRVPGMPLLVQWLLDVMSKMANVVLIFVFVFLITGIVGMELFKGTLHYRCALPGFVEGVEASVQAPFDTEIACHQADYPCTEHNLVEGSTCKFFTANPNHGVSSFDSIGLAFIMLAQGTTFDDWAESMYQLMIVYSPFVWIYFALVVLICGFCLANLFLAVIFLEYSASRSTIHGPEETVETSVQVTGAEDTAALLAGHELSDTSPSGDVSADNVSVRHPPVPGGDCKGLLATIAESSWLSMCATILVAINVVLMCMPYEGMTATYAANLEQGAMVISCLFIAEMGIKVTGLGCAGYWSDGWNVRKIQVLERDATPPWAHPDMNSRVDATLNPLLADAGWDDGFIDDLRDDLICSASRPRRLGHISTHDTHPTRASHPTPDEELARAVHHLQDLSARIAADG